VTAGPIGTGSKKKGGKRKKKGMGGKVFSLGNFTPSAACPPRRRERLGEASPVSFLLRNNSGAEEGKREGKKRRKGESRQFVG